MPSTSSVPAAAAAALNVDSAQGSTSSLRRVTFKEDEADEEHNEDEAIQV